MKIFLTNNFLEIIMINRFYKYFFRYTFAPLREKKLGKARERQEEIKAVVY